MMRGADLGLGKAAEEGSIESRCDGWRRFRGEPWRASRQPLPLRRGPRDQGGRMALKKLVAGNWKMHGLSADLGRDQGDRRCVARLSARSTSRLCVPAILIERASRAVPGFAIGGQDVHFADKGAHTGCVSAAMLLDAGASADHRRPFRAARGAARKRRRGEGQGRSALCRRGLDVILCVGESLAVREAGKARRDVSRRSSARRSRKGRAARTLAVAYEPIWAIGTGKVPTMARDRRDARGAARDGSSPLMARPARRSGFSTAARSRPRMPARFSPWPMLTARWSAGQASRPPISCRSSPLRAVRPVDPPFSWQSADLMLINRPQFEGKAPMRLILCFDHPIRPCPRRSAGAGGRPGAGAINVGMQVVDTAGAPVGTVTGHPGREHHDQDRQA